MIVLDGTWCEKGGELAWEGLWHFRTSDVGEVLEGMVRRMERHLRGSGLLRSFEAEDEPGGEGDPEGNLAASGVSGRAPPAGPQWVSRLAPLEALALWPAVEPGRTRRRSGFIEMVARLPCRSRGRLKPLGFPASPPMVADWHSSLVAVVRASSRSTTSRHGRRSS